jgi:hypothetical protein
LRATTIGSCAGLSAVPQPCQRSASGVAGVSRRSRSVLDLWSNVIVSPGSFGRAASRVTSRSAASCASIALPTSSDFGNPCPYSHAMVSRISKPASSMPAVSR